MRFMSTKLTIPRILLSWIVGAGLLVSLAPIEVHAQDNGILQPYSGQSLRGTVEISGVAAHDTFRKWQLDLLIDGDESQAAFLAVGEEQIPARATLTSLDTALYPPGRHLLRLRVVHSNLNYDEYTTPVVIGSGAAAAPPAPEADTALPVSAAVVEEKNTRPTGAQPALPSPKANNITFTPPNDGSRWIEVDISEQTLRAWEGDQLVFETLVSTGRPETPTVAGTFAVQSKLDSQRMRGPGYDLPDVPAVMYFFLNYAIHGAYWHDDFGQVMSHGCVNMEPDEAAFLFQWAEIGTPVHVHD